jgi:hypothetical protein
LPNVNKSWTWLKSEQKNECFDEIYSKSKIKLKSDVNKSELMNKIMMLSYEFSRKMKFSAEFQYVGISLI